MFERTGEGAYALTEVGAGLDGEAEQSFKSWAIFRSRDAFEVAGAECLNPVMTGKTAAELQGFASSFELMGRTPENVDKFNAGDDRAHAAGQRRISFASTISAGYPT